MNEMAGVDFIFRPFNKFGLAAVLVWVLIFTVVGSVFAFLLTTQGLNPGAAVSLVVGFALTYGLLFGFLNVAFSKKPE
ncbi:MAG: hypothetical protein ACTSVF_03480 [Candidatus Asgardarchaeia archaeon]